jgi:hypothetical protein
MKIIKHLTNIKINMLRYSNINPTHPTRELILTHMLFHSNTLRHFMILINIMFRQPIIIMLKEFKIPQLIINIKNRIILVIFLFLNIINLSSCAHDKYDNETLYNSVGFDQGSLPMTGQQKIAPDYFYRQAQGAMGGNIPQQGGQAPAYPQQQYQQRPQYQQPPQYQPQPPQYYPQTYGTVAPYQVYPNAGSRFYSNPYAIPPSPYYPQYDVDQYYVPPTYSYGMEQSGAPSNRSNNSR